MAFLVLSLMWTAPAMAYDIFDGVVYYNITGENTVAATNNIYDPPNAHYPEYPRASTPDVVIPETVRYNGKDYTVTAIESMAFYKWSGVNSITIPPTIAQIGEYAFTQCYPLRSLIVNLPVIWDNAFVGYYQVESVSLGDAVTKIGSGAFKSCSGIQSIVFPSSVTTIGNNAFQGCRSLKSITIPNSVTQLGKEVFRGCTSLQSVAVGNSLISIPEGAFRQCTSLTSIDFGNSVKTIYADAFRECTALESVNLSDAVTNLQKGAFYGCTSLKSVAFGNSMLTLSEDVFRQCTSLTSIDFGNSIKTIGKGAFRECTALSSVNVPNSVNTLGIGAFYGCTALKSVVLGAGLAAIPDEAFRSCTKLTDVSVLGTITWVSGNAFAETQALNRNPDGVVYIDKIAYQFDGTMPAGTTISIKDGTTSIVEKCFAGKTELVGIELPNSLQAIGMEAFNNCPNLTSLSIGPAVKSIGNGAFNNCPSLQSIEVSPSNPSFDSRGHCNAVVETASNTLIFGCANTVIPNTVTAIGPKAFSGCTTLQAIDIPNSVTTIGEQAFFNCTGLLSMTLPNSVTSIGQSCFYNCRQMSRLQLPTSVKSVGETIIGGLYGLRHFSCPANVFNMLKEFGPIYLDLLALTGAGDVQLAGNYMTNGNPHQVKTLSIGRGITGFGQGSVDVKEHVYCYAETPPACNAGTFANYNATLHVPPTATAAYFSADVWRNFTNLVNDAVEVASLSLSETEVQLLRGDQYALTAVVQPDNATRHNVNWVSYNPSVATVDSDGNVTAQAPGEALIAAYSEVCEATCRIVVADRKVTISLDRPRLTIKPGNLATLDYTISPTTDLDLVAESSDETVALARVVKTDASQVVQVVGLSDGVVTVTVRSDGGDDIQPATCRVAVSTAGISQGDINADTAVDVTDLALLIDVVLGKRSADDSDIHGTCHVSGNPTIDIADIAELIDIILGK